MLNSTVRILAWVTIFINNFWLIRYTRLLYSFCLLIVLTLTRRSLCFTTRIICGWFRRSAWNSGSLICALSRLCRWVCRIRLFCARSNSWCSTRTRCILCWLNLVILRITLRLWRVLFSCCSVKICGYRTWRILVDTGLV